MVVVGGERRSVLPPPVLAETVAADYRTS
jgi:dihydroorotase